VVPTVEEERRPDGGSRAQRWRLSGRRWHGPDGGGGAWSRLWFPSAAVKAGRMA
jgi:hypothetical protein